MKFPSVAETSQAGEGLLFLRRWLAHPLKVGAVLPSSPALARLVARQIKLGPDEALVELGAGTGSVTKALVEAGFPKDRLFVIEVDTDMCNFLRRQFPQVQVIHGDATRLADLIPSRWHNKVATVVSGIPMITLPMDVQKRMTKAWFEVLKPGGNMLQYTYSLVSPLPESKLGLKGRRKGIAFLNVPPAWVWSYEKINVAPSAA